MKILDLPVEKREKLGSANSRRYRRAGKIPCILYGRGQDVVPLAAGADAFDTVLKNHSALVRLTLDDATQTALVREIEWDTFGDHVQHIDLIRVEMEDEVRIKVPVHYVGIPVGAGEGGVPQIAITDLEVYARADSIPSELRIDISGLHVGDGIHVGEVDYPERVRPARPEGELMLNVKVPRKAEEPVAAEEAAIAEGEEAAPAEGEAAAPAAPSSDQK